MPLWPIIEVEIFNLWEIEYMGPFMPSYGKDYITCGSGLCVQAG